MAQTLKVHSLSPPLAYPGLLVRMAAFTIDAVIMLGVDIAAALLVIGPLAERLTVDPDTAARLTVIDAGAWIGIRWLYYAFWESSRMRGTPGAIACHLVVVDAEDGHELSFSQASIRYFGRYLSAGLAGLGWAPIYFQTERRALHDILSGATVLRFEPEANLQAIADAEPASVSPERTDIHENDPARSKRRQNLPADSPVSTTGHNRPAVGATRRRIAAAAAARKDRKPTNR